MFVPAQFLCLVKFSYIDVASELTEIEIVGISITLLLAVKYPYLVRDSICNDM